MRTIATGSAVTPDTATQLAVATAYVAVIAAALPRAYQITDDAVLTAAERGGDLVPHVGPAWSWALMAVPQLQ